MVQKPTPQTLRSTRLALTALGAAAIAAMMGSPAARPFVLNLTASVPIGIYLRASGPISIGDFVVVALPVPYRDLADQRGYLPHHRRLIKVIAARAPNVVCRIGARVWILRHRPVWVKHTDAVGRPLPAWRGCRSLKGREIFVLGTRDDSFDSRYVGPIEQQFIVARVLPILVSGASHIPGQ